MEYINFGSLVNIKSSKRIYASDYCKSGVPFFRGKEITNILKSDEFLYISEKKYKFIKENYGVPMKNDILITAVGTIGNTWIVDEREFYFKDGNILWIENYKDINSLFLKYSLEFSIKKINSQSNGSSQSAITMDVLKNVKIKNINDNDMNQIGNLLSTMDKLIEDKEELISKYELEKNWSMRNIFATQEEYRKRKFISELGKVITGKTPSTKIESNWIGDVPFITPTDMSSSKYITTERFVNKDCISPSYTLQKDAICYTCIASIGKMCMAKTTSITNQQINSIVVNDEYIPDYVYYYLQHITPIIKNLTGDYGMAMINKSEFSAVELYVHAYNEQEKIANLLSSMDKLLHQFHIFST